MLPRSLLILAVVVLSGCSHAMLPYKPDVQPDGGRVSAAYQVVGDRVRIEIDTSGKRLEQAWIFTPDGQSIAPHEVENPPVVATPGPIFSIGMGGASYGHAGGVGGGADVGVPIGGGSTHVEGNTILWFPLASTGPPPWRLYVKLAGVSPTTFFVGAPGPR
jgi:hypothetical protein